MEVAGRSQDVAAIAGVAQELPPNSILRGLPDGQYFATHPVDGVAVSGVWGWLSLINSNALAALRLCSSPQLCGTPSGIYTVEYLGEFERRPVPAAASSSVQSLIGLGAAMDRADKEVVSMSISPPEFELLVFRKGRLAVHRHAPEEALTVTFATFTLMRVTCGAFELVLPFMPAHDAAEGSGRTTPDLQLPPPDDIMATWGWGSGLRPVKTIAHVSHSPTRWELPLISRMLARFRSSSM